MSGSVTVRVRRLKPTDADVPLPRYMSDEAAGMDLAASVDSAVPLTLAPGGRAIVPTGLALEIPAGFEGQVRPRSGLAAKHGVTVANAPGTIDSDYRGELKVILVNLGEAPHVIRRGDRIAQLVIAPVVRARIELVDGALADSARGENGFGSSGSS